MNISIELATIAIEVLLPCYLFTKLLQKKGIAFAKIILYYFLYGVALFVGTTFISSSGLRVILLFLFSLLGNILIYRQSFITTIYITMAYYISVVLADVVCGSLLTLIGMPITELLGNGFIRFSYNCSCKLLNLSFIQILISIIKKTDDDHALFYSSPLLICEFVSLVICHQNFFLLYSGKNAFQIMIESVCLLLINVTICIYVEMMKRLYENQKQTALAEQTLSIQLEHYEYSMKQQEETRMLWHDIKKYLASMEALVEKQRQPEAQQCLEQVQNTFSQLEDIVDVGNSIVDSILTYGVKQCRTAGVQLLLNVWVNSELAIPAPDLYIIIGNTLDNAIEACAHLPPADKEIHLSLWQQNHMLYYEISNKYTKNIRPKSRKIHGYGLKNVKKCVENNNGLYHISKTDDTFTVEITLNV